MKSFLFQQRRDVPVNRCIQLTIPRSDEYLLIFIGWLRQLSLWFNWQRDADKNGKIAAGLWRQTLDMFLSNINAPCEDDMYFRLREKPTDSRIMQAQWEVDGDWFDVLDNTCCETPQAIYQFTATGELQVSYDNGETWQNDPNDPRNTLATLPPVTGSDARCDTARSTVGLLHQQADDLIATSGAWSSIGGLAEALIVLLIAVGIIGTGGALAPLLLAFAAAIIGIGSAALDAALTSTVYNQLQCMVFCALTEDGELTASGFAQLRANVESGFLGAAQIFILKTLDVWQLKGTINAGRLGITTDNDCTDCDCTACFYNWIAVTGQGGGTAETGTDAYGEYVQWTAELAAGEYRVFINATGEDYPADVNVCCIYQGAYFLAWNTAEDTVVEIGALGGFDCGDPSQAALNVTNGESTWGVKSGDPNPYKLRVYKQLVVL